MILRVGSRKSRLAKLQVDIIRRLVTERVPGLSWEQHLIETSGDRIDEQPLRDFGGKGLFVLELDEALLSGRIDCAVHSLKDVPTDLPAGVAVVGVPPRADARDVLVSRVGWDLADLPPSARVGTVSPRRAAQALRMRGDLRMVPMRGNVETRLRKVEAGEVDATFLAMAGLVRLGLCPGSVQWVVLDPFRFVPAPGQGTLCVTIREGDDRSRDVFRMIEDGAAFAAARCERAAARVVGGSCFLPIGIYAQATVGQLRVVAELLSPDGKQAVRRESTGSVDTAERLGASLGEELLAAGGAEIVAAADGRL